MKSLEPSGDLNELRELGPYEAGNLFFVSHNINRARITAAHPIVGVLVLDRFGKLYLTPEPDYQGRDEVAIPLQGIEPQSSGRFFGSVVKIAGVFDKSTGITVEKIAAYDEPF